MENNLSFIKYHGNNDDNMIQFGGGKITYVEEASYGSTLNLLDHGTIYTGNVLLKVDGNIILFNTEGDFLKQFDEIKAKSEEYRKHIFESIGDKGYNEYTEIKSDGTVEYFSFFFVNRKNNKRCFKILGTNVDDVIHRAFKFHNVRIIKSEWIINKQPLINLI